MNIIINSNAESLAGEWSDIMDGETYADEDCAARFAATLSREIDKHLPHAEWRYENGFYYWHGGPGAGHYHVVGAIIADEGRKLTDCVAVAIAAARKEAQQYAREGKDERVKIMSDDMLSDLSWLYNKLADARDGFEHREDDHPAAKRLVDKVRKLVDEVAVVLDEEKERADAYYESVQS